jgi:hypothetical protein
MNKKNIDDFIEYLESHSIAPRSSLIGCTKEEVDKLERKYSPVFPSSYRSFLLNMGHKSGRLFSHDHFAIHYSYVLELTDSTREELTNTQSENNVCLPADAFVILDRLGEQFQFIRCNNREDSPVWYLAEWEPEIKQTHSSVYDWLYDIAEEALEAINSGYYDTYPEGTTP